MDKICDFNKENYLNELVNYFIDKQVSSHSEYRKKIENSEDKGAELKENYVKSIAYQTLDSDERFKEVVKIAKSELENNYSATRCFCELIQNIDDCRFDDIPKVLIIADTDNNTIELCYNEKGFEYRDVYGICSYGYTTKKEFEITNGECRLKIEKDKTAFKNGIYSRYKTGEKGVGFKSVYKIADKVEIYSNSFKIRLYSDYPMVPIWIDEDNKDDGMTHIILHIKDEIGLDSFIDDLEKEYFCRDGEENYNILVNNNLLFTKKIKEVEIVNKNNSGEVHKWFVIENEEISKIGVEVITQDAGEGIRVNSEIVKCAICKFDFCIYSEKKDDAHKRTTKLFKYVENVEIPEEVVMKRYQSKAENFIAETDYNKDDNIKFCGNNHRRNIAFVTEIDKNSDVKGSYYTTLPLNKKTDMPFSVDAPFNLNQERSDIDMPENTNICEWNKEIYRKVEECYVNYLEIIRDYDDKICEIIDNANDKEYINWNIPKEIKILKEYETREYISISECCCFEKEYCYDLLYPNKIIDFTKPGKKLVDKVYNKSLCSRLNKENKCLIDDLNFDELEIFWLDGRLVKIKELECYPYELIIDGDNEDNHAGCFYNLRKLLPSSQCDEVISMISKKIGVVSKEEVIVSINNKLEEYSKNVQYYNELSKYYSFVFKGCCAYVDEKSWKKLKFPYLYAFGKIRLQANEELSYMDCFEPFLYHLKYSSTVSEKFVEKWNELVKSVNDFDRASYIIKRVSKEDFKKNNNITETELARGALLAALIKEKPDENKIRLKCSIKNIIEAMSMYCCECKENDGLLEKYYEYNEMLNAFFELEFTDDKEEVIDSEVIKIIKEHCSKFEIKEELKKKLQELVDKKYYNIKNLDKEKEIHYIVVGNDVFCLSDNEGDCIRYYAEKLIGRKDDIIINIIQAATKREEFEQYLREEKGDKKKEFIDFLTNYRHYQCNSGFDLNNIIEEIKGKNGKVWLEILQNINDAREDLSEEEKEEPIVVSIDEECIEISYRERGFSYKDVAGITDLGNGGKEEIGTATGEKGIGFKSIFYWCEKVEIESNGFHFSIGDNEKNIEKYTVPRWLDDSKPEKGKTVLRFILKADKPEDIKKEIINKDSCLCLDNCYRFVILEEGRETIEIDINKMKNDRYAYFVSIKEVFDNEIYDWMRQRKKWANMEKEELDRIAEKLRIQYYFKEEISNKKWRKEDKYVTYYATLPLGEIDEYCSLIINAPFETSMNRKEKLENDYNRKLEEIILNRFSDAVYNAKRQAEFLKNLEGNILFLFNGNEELDKYKSRIKELELFSCMKKIGSEWQKDKCKISDILKIGDPLVYELIEKLQDDNFISEIPKENGEEKNYLTIVLESLTDDKCILIKNSSIPQYSIVEIEKWVGEGSDFEYLSFISDVFKQYLPEAYKYEENSFFDLFKKLFYNFLEKKPKNNLEDFNLLPIYPYVSETGDTWFSKIESDKWFYCNESNEKSKDYYKIIDLEWLYKVIPEDEKENLDDTRLWFARNIVEISEFSNDVVVKHLEKELVGKVEYSKDYWDILRQIYDLERKE